LWLDGDRIIQVRSSISTSGGSMYRRISSLLFVAALSVVGLASPSYAGAPVDRFKYSDTDTFTECDGAYEVASSFSGMILITDTNPSLDGQFFRFSDNYEFTDVITNPLNGEYVVLHGNGNVKELQPRSLGDGIFTFHTHDSGLFTIRDSSGRVLLKETGIVEFAYVFDTLNDGQPGGDFLFEEFVRVSGPHPSFSEEFDFCSFLDDAIG
jgi:hypothetical protein